MSLSDLMIIWSRRPSDGWYGSPEKYTSLAQEILALGEPLAAYDVVREAILKWPNNPRLRQLQGLALARSGATERANVILEELRQSGHTDEETLGMLARTYKDLGLQAGTTGERNQYWRRSAETYLQAYQGTGGYWSGINAATMSVLVNREKQGRELAKRVYAQCQQALSRRDIDEYWVRAAMAEAALILRDWAEAEKWYGRAAKKSSRRFGDISSTRRNARLILQHWKHDGTNIEEHLAIPPVIVFTGHMIDAPDRIPPRFPTSLETTVAVALRERIDGINPGFGFASAACGSDILFLEAMLDSGAEVSIVLPYNKDEFIRDSIDFSGDSDWRRRFERVVRRATRCIVASVNKLKSGSVSYDFANELLFGFATLHARRIQTSLIPLAVWDGRPGDGPGGTASTVENWRRSGHVPQVIDLTKVSLPESSIDLPTGPVKRKAQIVRKGGKTFLSRIVALLFADAVGFSKLSEDEVAGFVQHFLGAIAGLSRKFGEHIIAKNTWGDGLYLVFSEIHSAGEFALEMADLTCLTSWQKKGLPAGLNLRIALHAGPVYEFDDPITGKRTYGGTHVSRAARIEPVTPAGHVYASEAFAALAAARNVDNFVCDYVGQTALPKEYGMLPMYHVRRRTGMPQE